jgi:cytochrome b561
MRLKNSIEGYGAISQLLHWLVVALVIVAWLSGMLNDAFPRGTARSVGLFVHISMGLAIIVLVVARVLWRAGNPPPPPEMTFLGKWADYSARVTHIALYALLVVVPAVGIVLQFARGNALPVFGLLEISSPWAADRAFAHAVKERHELLANVLMVLAGLHAVAALAHHWVLRDRTLLRMLPASNHKPVSR